MSLASPVLPQVGDTVDAYSPFYKIRFKLQVVLRRNDVDVAVLRCVGMIMKHHCPLILGFATCDTSPVTLHVTVPFLDFRSFPSHSSEPFMSFSTPLLCACSRYAVPVGTTGDALGTAFLEMNGEQVVSGQKVAICTCSIYLSKALEEAEPSFAVYQGIVGRCRGEIDADGLCKGGVMRGAAPSHQDVIRM